MFKNYVYLKNGQVNYEEQEVLSTSSTLEPGLYEVRYIYSPLYKVVVRKLEIKNRPVVHNDNTGLLDNIIDSFLDDSKNIKLKKFNISNRFGVLLYGDAGTGKSSIINNCISKSTDSISFIIIDKDEERIQHCWEWISRVRLSQDNKFFIVFDEFDEYMKSESVIKQIMDGQYSIDNCLFIMSTNYINDIPETIKDRPSRCKYKIKVEGIYDTNVIYEIIKDLDLNEDDINKAKVQLKGKTLDEIKNFCVDKILNLKELDNNKKTIGFKKN